MIYLVPGQHIHFVGIGGTGISAIARILLQQGFYVSGSDQHSNEHTEALRREGAEIFHGHDPAHVNGAEMVVISSAVSPENIEILSAHAQGIPVYKRSDIIGAVMQGHQGIAVAGTHGKTTTTAMITHILIEAGQDPSYIIGSALSSTGLNASIGGGRVFVIEADEYDNMFHGLRPQIEVITSVEYDHPDFFKTPGEMVESFRRFIGLLPADGLLVACADNPTTAIFANNRFIVNLPVATYGIDNPKAKWQAVNLHYDETMTHFEVLHEGQKQGAVTLPVPGRHNVLNATAALIAALQMGVSFADAAYALSTFQGTSRRFELRGKAGGVIVIDDYAHHPTAIRATLEAARQRYPQHKLWAVWQPHTYSRTRQLYDAFLAAFDRADHVLITDIYVSREQPAPDMSSADLAQSMQHPDARYMPSFEETVETLARDVSGPAVVLIMSAGDAPRIGINYLSRLQGGSSE